MSTQEVYEPDGASLAQLGRMILGGRVAQVVTAAAELGIPDLLVDGARTSGELAEAIGAHAPSTHRFMRAMAALGLVQEDGDRYSRTPLGAALRSDTPQRFDLTARYMGHEVRLLTWGRLAQSIRTGVAAFPEVFGMESWEYNAQHPEFERLFNESMTVGSRRRQGAILDAYDFSRFNTIVDVGGGHGQLLGALLQRYPHMRGTIFDQPHVVEGAGPVLEALGVEDRCHTAGGSFFETVVTGGDACILKFILHDWDDEKALEILQNVHRAMAPGGTLLVIERVLPDDCPPTVEAALMDLHMLVVLHGKERTRSEFEQLYEQAGFRLTEVVPTRSDVSLIEGARV